MVAALCSVRVRSLIRSYLARYHSSSPCLACSILHLWRELVPRRWRLRLSLRAYHPFLRWCRIALQFSLSPSRVLFRQRWWSLYRPIGGQQPLKHPWWLIFQRHAWFVPWSRHQKATWMKVPWFWWSRLLRCWPFLLQQLSWCLRTFGRSCHLHLRRGSHMRIVQLIRRILVRDQRSLECLGCVQTCCRIASPWPSW